MLLDESKWRIDILGPWSKGLVRAETKWRYGLYKRWLQFLDEGLGDAFDVLPSDFDEEEEDDDDEEEGGGRRNMSRATERGDDVKDARALRYERWLKLQMEKEDDWEDRRKVEVDEERRRRQVQERGGPDVRNKREWFEDEEDVYKIREDTNRGDLRNKNRVEKNINAADRKQATKKRRGSSFEDYDEL